MSNNSFGNVAADASFTQCPNSSLSWETPEAAAYGGRTVSFSSSLSEHFLCCRWFLKARIRELERVIMNFIASECFVKLPSFDKEPGTAFRAGEYAEPVRSAQFHYF